jgi:ATP-binding cassette, subfamily B, bacterial
VSSNPWLWPADQLPRALAALTRGTRPAGPADGKGPGDPPALALAAGLQAVPVEWTGRPTAGLVRQLAPGWARSSDGGYVLLRRGFGGVVQLVTPSGRRWTRARTVATLLDRPGGLAGPRSGAAWVDGVLGSPEVRPHRRRAAAAALAEGCPVPDGACVRLQPGPQAPMWRHLIAERIIAPATLALLLVVVGYAAVAAHWAYAGRRLLDGTPPSWVLAWTFLAVAAVLARVGSQAALGTAVTRLSGWGKRRVLARATRLDPDAVFRAGPGWVLGRTFDVEAADAGITGGGAATVVGAAELLVAAALCPVVPGGLLVLAGLVGHLAVTSGIVAVLLARKRRWLAARRVVSTSMTEDLLAHPSRLVQGRPAGDAERLRTALVDVEDAGTRSDRTAAWLVGASAPAWLLLALLLLAVAWHGAGPDDAGVAGVLGVVLLAAAGVESLAVAVDDLTDGVLALQQARELSPSDEREDPATGHAATGGTGRGITSPTSLAAAVIEAHEVHVTHPGRDRPSLEGFNLTLRHGERVLLTGPSGAGKSTAIAAMTGELAVDSGALRTTGRVVAVPQQHRNHLFSGTLAFNLLLGRSWPPTPDDLDAAERLCRALELGPLLDRMPSGLNQLVGETGWQLSDGERTRVQAARALLQQPDVVLLDETLSALDPLTAEACRLVIAREAGSLLLTYHP